MKLFRGDKKHGGCVAGDNTCNGVKRVPKNKKQTAFHQYQEFVQTNLIQSAILYKINYKQP